MEKPNHLASWAVSFAGASLGVWLTWVNYLWSGFRFRVPDWFLVNERLFFTAELLVLTIGCAVTAYASGAFKPRPEDDVSAAR